jgi:hypothetical protein
VFRGRTRKGLTGAHGPPSRRRPAYENAYGFFADGKVIGGMGIEEGTVIDVGMVVGNPDGIVVGNPDGIAVGNPEGIAVGIVGASGVRTVCPEPLFAAGEPG